MFWGGVAGVVHHAFTTVLFIFIIMHVMRAVGYRYRSTGAAAWRSGVVIVAAFIFTCGTGYSIGDGGEAAFWASVISVSPIASLF